MPVSVQWHNEQQTILHMVIVGQTQWHEFYEAEQQVTRYLSDTRHTVDIVIIFDEPLIFPPLGRALSHMRQLVNHHPNRGQVFFVTPPTVVRLLLDTALKIVRLDHCIVKNVQEAHHIITMGRAKTCG